MAGILNETGVDCFINAMLWFIFHNVTLKTSLITDLNAVSKITDRDILAYRLQWKEEKRSAAIEDAARNKPSRKSVGGYGFKLLTFYLTFLLLYTAHITTPNFTISDSFQVGNTHLYTSSER